jgi:hypothetical protein
MKIKNIYEEKNIWDEVVSYCSLEDIQEKIRHNLAKLMEYFREENDNEI